jgi:hypothetical protein
MPHVLATHVAVPFAGTGHALPHVLQLVGDEVVSTHPTPAPQYCVLASAPQDAEAPSPVGASASPSPLVASSSAPASYCGGPTTTVRTSSNVASPTTSPPSVEPLARSTSASNFAPLHASSATPVPSADHAQMTFLRAVAFIESPRLPVPMDRYSRGASRCASGTVIRRIGRTSAFEGKCA